MPLNAISAAANIFPKAVEPLTAAAAVTRNILPEAARQTTQFAGTAARNGIEGLSSLGLA